MLLSAAGAFITLLTVACVSDKAIEEGTDCGEECPVGAQKELAKKASGSCGANGLFTAAGDTKASGTCEGTGECQIVCRYPECPEGQSLEITAESFKCLVNSSDPCASVTCSGHGRCRNNNGQAQCICDLGYYDDGAQCIEGANPDSLTEGDLAADVAGVDGTGSDTTTPTDPAVQGWRMAFEVQLEAPAVEGALPALYKSVMGTDAPEGVRHVTWTTSTGTYKGLGAAVLADGRVIRFSEHVLDSAELEKLKLATLETLSWLDDASEWIDPAKTWSAYAHGRAWAGENRWQRVLFPMGMELGDPLGTGRTFQGTLILTPGAQAQFELLSMDYAPSGTICGLAIHDNSFFNKLDSISKFGRAVAQVTEFLTSGDNPVELCQQGYGSSHYYLLDLVYGPLASINPVLLQNQNGASAGAVSVSSPLNELELEVWP